MNKKYIDELLEIIKEKKPSKEQLSRIKIRLCSKYKLKEIPTDIEILLNLKKEQIKKYKKYLTTKPVRTLSGVAVIAVMTKPIKCPHGRCVMCPGGPDSIFGNIPQSYTGKEPATRRAIRNKYDPYLQVMNRLEQYIVIGHLPEKIELIVMGGTFPSFPKKYQEEFIKYCFKAMNDFSYLFFIKNKLDILRFKEFFELPGDIEDKKRQKNIQNKLLSIKKIELNEKSLKIINKIFFNKNQLIKNKEQLKKSIIKINNKKLLKKLKIKKTNLETEQLKNEKSNIKCVGLTIETRPDYGKLKQGNEMLRLGATRVELGVQTVYDDVLEKIERGHTVEDSIESTRILKDLGFKINYHLMPGLPGVNRKKDLAALKEIFYNEDFRPDMLKIYPCMVLKGTKLYRLWKQKKYKPLTTKKAAELIIEFKKYIPEYVRVMRVQRDIPSFMAEAGVDRTNLRQYINELMKKRKIKCKCIRCREPGKRKISKKIEIKTIHYIASAGNEFFISVEDVKNDIILGFCRLRFPSKFLRKEITEDSALIRELHVYGAVAEIGKKGRVQHKGIGKALLKVAEEIAKTYYKGKMVVISGVGVRNYYRKVGYKREGCYMIKKI